MPLRRPNIETALRTTSWIVAASWAWKAITAARGLPKVPDLNLPEHDRSPTGNPSVTVIVPACNEEAAVAACLTSLLHQVYPNLHIIAVDDRSTDRTGQILDTLAAANPTQLTALHIHHLPRGWLGKPHAMHTAVQQAGNPDWLLFTDADVLFAPDAIRRSLAFAETERADHFVTLPTPIIRTRGEAMLLSFLPLLALWATRPWRVADPNTRDAIGVGAFNLIRATAFHRLGGFEAIPMEILEDLTLALRVKLSGLRQRVAFAPGLVGIHWAPGALGVVNVMTKNLFAVFRFRIVFLVFACLWLLVVCVGPAVALFHRSTRTPALIAVTSIATLYRLFSRSHGISAWNARLFPVAATLFAYSLLRSLVITLQQRGVLWRGTFYPLRDLRQNAGPMIPRAPKLLPLEL